MAIQELAPQSTVDVAARPAGTKLTLFRLVLTRVAYGLLTLFIISTLVFFAVQLLPGDAAQAILGRDATPEALAALRHSLGLNLPASARYFIWLGGVFHGNWGVSIGDQQPVAQLVAPRLANTAFLAIFGAAIAVPCGLVGGVAAALHRDTYFDKCMNGVTLAFASLPDFFVGYLLIFVLAVKLGLFPGIADVDPSMSLADHLYSAFLPALTLSLLCVAHIMRMTRAAIISVLSSPYIEMARMKGVNPLRVIMVHAMPNVLAPILNVLAFNLAYLVVAVVVVEVVFAYPGLGQLLIDSVSKRDVPVVQAVSVIFAGAFVFLNMLADFLAIVANPRLLHPR